MDQSLDQVGTADLQRATISQDALSRIIMRTQSPQGISNAQELLAQFLRTQIPAKLHYNIYPFNYPGKAGGGGIVFQILPQNINRKFLMVQFEYTFSNALAAILFEEHNTTPNYITNAQAQQLQGRGILTNLGAADSDNLRSVTFNPPPSNAISIVGYDIGIANDIFSGVVIEGV